MEPDAKPLAAPSEPPAPPAPGLLTNEQAQKVIDALNERGARANCPRCGNEHFGLVNAISLVGLQAPGQALAPFMGGPTVPCVLAYCTRCGFISVHALGVLGFLNPEGKVTGI
jgi:hypothetical protein